MASHPILVPGKVTVRWLADDHGVCHGRDYLEANPDCAASLLALARQVSIKGVVNKVPENGHRLNGEFADLSVLKPGDHRFMIFRDGNVVYITNGAPKRKVAKQREDYRIALRLRASYFAGSRKR